MTCVIYVGDHSVKFPLLPTMMHPYTLGFVLCNHHVTCVIYVVVKLFNSLTFCNWVVNEISSHCIL